MARGLKLYNKHPVTKQLCDASSPDFTVFKKILVVVLMKIALLVLLCCFVDIYYLSRNLLYSPCLLCIIIIVYFIENTKIYGDK